MEASTKNNYCLQLIMLFNFFTSSTCINGVIDVGNFVDESKVIGSIMNKKCVLVFDEY